MGEKRRKEKRRKESGSSNSAPKKEESETAAPEKKEKKESGTASPPAKDEEKKIDVAVPETKGSSSSSSDFETAPMKQEKKIDVAAPKAEQYFDFANPDMFMSQLFATKDMLEEKAWSYGTTEVPLLPAIVAVVVVILWSFFPRRKSEKGRGPKCSRTDDQGGVEDILRSLGADEEGTRSLAVSEEGSMIPSTGLFIGNSEEPGPFENEWMSGGFLAMHRATHDKELNKSGEYRYGEYFLGKKRLWECRFQFKFKQPPPDAKDVFFGLELEEYVPMNAATKRMMSVLVENLKVAVGKQIYHTPGDDPTKVSGPLERPTFVMPLYAFDQFIVTPPGESPPRLTDPAMPTLGSVRVGRVREYKKEIEELELKMGYTYTFNFWGISQWLDRLNWQVIMPLLRTRVDFNAFCGRPPVHVVIYTLKAGSVHKDDPRHLQFKKNYMFDIAFWSSLHRPPKEIVHSLFRGVPRRFSPLPASGKKKDGKRTGDTEQKQGFFSKIATCCVSRPGGGDRKYSE